MKPRVRYLSDGRRHRQWPYSIEFPSIQHVRPLSAIQFRGILYESTGCGSGEYLLSCCGLLALGKGGGPVPPQAYTRLCFRANTTVVRLRPSLGLPLFDALLYLVLARCLCHLAPALRAKDTSQQVTMILYEDTTASSGWWPVHGWATPSGRVIRTRIRLPLRLS